MAEITKISGEIYSENNKYIQPIPYPIVTTTERDALSVDNGYKIYNSTTSTYQMYNGTAWNDIFTASSVDETFVKNNAFDVNVESALSGDTIDLDCSDNTNFFDIYLDRPFTRINLPTNARNGEVYRVQIRQDGTGGRFLKWGNKDTFTGLNASINTGMGGTIILYVHSGTFDWSKLRADAGRKSFIDVAGFINNVNTFNGVKLSSFDESAGTITLDGAKWDIIDENTVAGVTISIENAFYFTDEKGDDWIGQFPYGVTQFEFFTTTDGASALLTKKGVYSNSLYTQAKVTFEETLTDDFINGSDDGLLNWREGNYNGTTTTSTADIDAEHPGLLIQRLNGGATADGRTSTTMGTDMFNISNKRIIIEGVIKPNESGFTTPEVNYYFGWSDNVQFQSMNDGVVFQIIADGTGKGRIHCVTAIGAVDTDYDTGIDLLEDEWHSLKIGLPPNGIGIHFIVDNILVHTADRATFNENEKVTCGFSQYYDYTDTALPNNKEWFIDAFSLKYRMNNNRI